RNTKTRGGWEDRRSGTRTRGGTDGAWRPDPSPAPQGQRSAGPVCAAPWREAAVTWRCDDEASANAEGGVARTSRGAESRRD
ncbi:unnamed protein product, partial [Gulo gulo]